MKITCAKRSREEIIRDRDAYDANRKALHDQYDAQMQSYRKEMYDTYDNVRQLVLQELVGFESLNLDVDVDQRFEGTLRVRVRSNDNDVHSEHKALSWDWSAALKESTGEVLKESGSWSGLQACTEEQLESLRQSVRCLEILNSMDWATILSTPVPNADDYITVSTYDVDRNRPDFERELREAEIEDCIGQRKLVIDKNGRLYGILKETPKFYQVFFLPYHRNRLQEYINESGMSMEELVERNSKYPDKVSKDKFLAQLPKEIEVIEY